MDAATRHIERTALAVAIGMLGALIGAAAALRPGQNAAAHASDLRLLGEGASLAAFDLWASLDDAETRRAA